MTQKSWTCSSVKETLQCAKKFAAQVEPGTVLALEGDLGSGKTTFIKGLADGLGFHSRDEVTSPTFTLMHIYQGRCPIFHFDLYRLADEKEVASIGFDEFVSNPEAVVCIEWADKVKKLLPKHTQTLRFEIQGPTSRRIHLIN
ncbi:tRNA (adenosine(37)-N6)-threonylcarbamoyltransferase complex ATPase subunit type 1 TsaE [Omnitrophica bacterium]|nr:tRNA (adenosine(37)-N6)-threonylcarbamoyltransferase complex ATPase subunit type 1 TsaE [Candidatus Omnitrophota bacterium]